MPRYLIWKSGPGPLDIEFKRMGEAVLRPSLLIVTPGKTITVPREDSADIALFHLTEDDVVRLLSSPGGLRPPCMAFQCDAFLSMTPGPAADTGRRRWGWAIRVSRDGHALPGHYLDGKPLVMCRDGFTRARLRTLPNQSGVARDHDIIGLT